MESALVRQARVGPAPRKGVGAIRIALGLAATVLVAAGVVLQPFAASHLFPAHPVSSPAAPAPAAPAAPADVRTTVSDRPIAAEPAIKPPRLLPGGAVTGPAVALLFAAPNSMPPDASPVPPAVAVPPAPSAAAGGDSRAASAAVPASEPAAIGPGGTPSPREPLPLQTDLIGPGSPGASASARPEPIAAGRHD
jgi:hypothetical protein